MPTSTSPCTRGASRSRAAAPEDSGRRPVVPCRGGCANGAPAPSGHLGRYEPEQSLDAVRPRRRTEPPRFDGGSGLPWVRWSRLGGSGAVQLIRCAQSAPTQAHQRPLLSERRVRDEGQRGPANVVDVHAATPGHWRTIRGALEAWPPQGERVLASRWRVPVHPGRCHTRSSAQAERTRVRSGSGRTVWPTSRRSSGPKQPGIRLPVVTERPLGATAATRSRSRSGSRQWGSRSARTTGTRRPAAQAVVRDVNKLLEADEGTLYLRLVLDPDPQVVAGSKGVRQLVPVGRRVVGVLETRTPLQHRFPAQAEVNISPRGEPRVNRHFVTHHRDWRQLLGVELHLVHGRIFALPWAN